MSLQHRSIKGQQFIIDKCEVEDNNVLKSSMSASWHDHITSWCRIAAFISLITQLRSMLMTAAIAAS